MMRGFLARALIALFIPLIVASASLLLHWEFFQQEYGFYSLRGEISQRNCASIQRGENPAPNLNCDPNNSENMGPFGVSNLELCRAIQAHDIDMLYQLYGCGVSQESLTFHQYIWKNQVSMWIPQILASAMGIFILLTTFSLFKNHKSIGWKRLSIAVSCITALAIGYYRYDLINNSGFINNTLNSLVEITFSTLSGFVVVLMLSLLTGDAVAWIRNGFAADNPSTEKTAASSKVIELEPAPPEVSATFWSRFWARGIDLSIVYIFTILIGMFVPDYSTLISPTFTIFMGFLIMWMLLCVTLIGYDYIWLSLTGSSPGKMLFGMRVIQHDGNQLSGNYAYHRATGLLTKGLYAMFFFPYLQILSAFQTKKALTQTFTTPWDGIATSVRQKKISIFRRLIACAIGVFAITGMLALQQYEKLLTKQIIQDQYVGRR